MQCDAQLSPASISPTHYAPYNSTLASSASTSTTSVWSDTSSQSSDDSSSSHSSDSDSCESYCLSQQIPDKTCYRSSLSQTFTEAVPAELRQNPRRTSGPHGRAAAPPTLVRQSERKVNFVDSLVGRSKLILLTQCSYA